LGKSQSSFFIGENNEENYQLRILSVFRRKQAPPIKQAPPKSLQEQHDEEWARAQRRTGMNPHDPVVEAEYQRQKALKAVAERDEAYRQLRKVRRVQARHTPRITPKFRRLR
jgi:hypothetical protein